jgi:hypothetical protein
LPKTIIYLKKITLRYFLVAILFSDASQVRASDFCEGYLKGYTSVYVMALAKQPEQLSCPSQPAKDFGEQSDYAHGYQLGSVDGLTDGYQQS